MRKLICFASDAAYMYENIRRPVAIGRSSCSCVFDNRQAVQLFHDLSQRCDTIVVPGHDPQMCKKFPFLGDNPRLLLLYTDGKTVA